MTDNDKRALRILIGMRETRAGNFGLALSRGECRKPPQAYARPGGRALARLVKLGYAEKYVDRCMGGNWGWCITLAGIVAAREMGHD